MSYIRVVRRNGLLGSYTDPNGVESQAPNSLKPSPGEVYGAEPRPDHLKPYSEWSADERLVAAKSGIRGDMRRLENDQRDEQHLAEYARRAGITSEQARSVLDAFFEGDF